MSTFEATTVVLLVLLVLSLIGNVVMNSKLRTSRQRHEAAARRSVPLAPPATPARPLAPPAPAASPRPAPSPPPPPADPPWVDAAGLAQPQGLSSDRQALVDSTVDGAAAGPLTIRAASVRGDVHRRQGESRRDAFLCLPLTGFNEPVLLSVVAAGRPDGGRSHVASEEACRAVVTYLEKFPVGITEVWWGGDHEALTSRLGDVMAGVSERLTHTARREHLDAHECSVEIACLLTELGDRQQRRHVAFGVGSGALLVRNGSGWQRHADLEAAATGAAHSLPATSHPWIRPLTTGPGTVVLLTTGPASRFAQTHADGWERPHGLLDFLWRVSAGGGDTGPDRTAVCLWDRP